MDIRGLPREQKMLIAAGAQVVFIVSLFLKWFGPMKATDVDSWFIALILAIVAGAIFAAEALNVALPPQVASLGLGAFAASLVFFWALTHVIDGAELKVGAWLGLIASIVGVVLAWMIWREERT